VATILKLSSYLACFSMTIGRLWVTRLVTCQSIKLPLLLFHAG